MFSAPAGSIPSPIDELSLAIGIEPDSFGIGDDEWPPAADGCPDEPEEQAAATSASAATPMAPRNTEPGRERPRDADLDMNKPPPVPTR